MKYRTLDECITRYPRLIRNMRFVAILSVTEAGACLRDFRNGSEYSGEAVNHFGGTRAVIERAIKIRHRLYLIKRLAQK